MKLNDLLKNKTIKSFFIFAFVIFLSLPIIFPETSPLKIIKRENVFTHEDSPLPIFPKENLFKKYVNRVKEFYNLEKNSQNDDKNTEANFKTFKQEKVKSEKYVFDEEDNSDTDENDLLTLYTLEDNTDKHTHGTKDPVNLQEGTVLTKDNLLLKPQVDGYYYQDNFFKNGTYPQFANRRYIEGALSKYHNKLAANFGKRAFYYQDTNGKLTVNYADKLPNNYTAENILSPKSYEDNIYIALSKFKDAYGKYKDAHVNHRTITDFDIALASLQDMHSAYELLKAQIQNGMLVDFIDVQTLKDKGSENSARNLSDIKAINDFFNNSNNSDITISDKPAVNNNNLIADTEDTLTIVMGDKNFSEDYAYAIHDLGCSTGEIFTRREIKEHNIAQKMEENPLITIQLGTCAPPLEISPSSEIDTHISQSQEAEELKTQINALTQKSAKTKAKIVSTDRNIVPIVEQLNDEQSVTNIYGKPVTIIAVAPKAEERDLANTLESITSSVIEEKSDVEKLNKTLSEYYLTTQLKPTNTILAFPAGDDKVFVVNDPNNSYWIKNPKEVNQYPKQYMIKKGVYYEGAIISNKEVGNMVNKDKTNLLLVSDASGEKRLENGSVLLTIKEDDVNINSLAPQAIVQNTSLIKQITKIGDETLNSLKNIIRKKKQEELKYYDPEKKKSILTPRIASKK